MRGSQVPSSGPQALQSFDVFSICWLVSTGPPLSPPIHTHSNGPHNRWFNQNGRQQAILPYRTIEKDTSLLLLLPINEMCYLS